MRLIGERRAAAEITNSHYGGTLHRNFRCGDVGVNWFWIQPQHVADCMRRLKPKPPIMGIAIWHGSSNLFLILVVSSPCAGINMGWASASMDDGNRRNAHHASCRGKSPEHHPTEYFRELPLDKPSRRPCTRL